MKIGKYTKHKINLSCPMDDLTSSSQIYTSDPLLSIRAELSFFFFFFLFQTTAPRFYYQKVVQERKLISCDTWMMGPRKDQDQTSILKSMLFNMWYSGNGFLSKEIITLMMLVVIMVKHRKNFWHLLQKGQMWLLWKKKKEHIKR